MDKLRFLVAVFAAAAFGGCVDDTALRVTHAPRTLAPSPVVALPDPGVDDSHPELRGRVVFPAGHAELLYVTDGLRHGTAMASVITRVSPKIRVASLPWSFRDYREWKAVRDGCMTGDQRACAVAWEHVVNHLGYHTRLWERYPIVNFSHGLDVLVGDRVDAERVRVTLELLAHVRSSNPRLWDAYVQRHVPAHLRAVSVRAIGNRRDDDGSGASDLHRAITYLHPELWGHTLFVTALDPATGVLADYANFCGHVPPRWNARRHGSHFCVAAPGTHRAATPGKSTEVQRGTSYASAYVSGLLADLHLRCGGLRGVVLVTKTLEDALRRVPLLRIAVAAIVLKPLLDQPGKLVELRSAHRRRASVARRHRKLKHLPHALA